MFADITPVEETSTLASYLPVVGWGLLGLLALAIAWKLWSKHDPGGSGALADRVRGLLVKRGRSTAGKRPEEVAAPAATSTAPPTSTPQPDAVTEEAPRGVAAPDAPEGGAPAAPAAVAPEEPAATGAAPVRPLPQHDAAPPVEDGPSTGAIKALIVAAALPSLFALPYIAWSIADLLIDRVGAPTAAAITAGLVADVALIGSVVVALSDPKSRVAATRAGWVFAVVAAGLVAVHAGLTVAIVVAVIPLLSKALWGLVVDAVHRLRAARAAHTAAVLRRQEEEAAAKDGKVAELSTDLEHERLAEIAQLERDALYEERVAAAKLKKKLAVSEAEHLEALAEIKRLGEQKRAEDEESAKVYENQERLRRKFRALRGDVPAYLAVQAGAEEDVEVVPEITAKAGFGSVSPPAFGFQRPLDVRALTPEGAKVRFEELKPNQQALVKYVHTAKEPTQRGAGKKLGKDESTIRRWKKGLEELGYELPFGEK